MLKCILDCVAVAFDGVLNANPGNTFIPVLRVLAAWRVAALKLRHLAQRRPSPAPWARELRSTYRQRESSRNYALRCCAALGTASMNLT